MASPSAGPGDTAPSRKLASGYEVTTRANLPGLPVSSTTVLIAAEAFIFPLLPAVPSGVSVNPIVFSTDIVDGDPFIAVVDNASAISLIFEGPAVCLLLTMLCGTAFTGDPMVFFPSSQSGISSISCGDDDKGARSRAEGRGNLPLSLLFLVLFSGLVAPCLTGLGDFERLDEGEAMARGGLGRDVDGGLSMTK